MSAEVKAEILRELLENQVPPAHLSEWYQVNVSSVYNWHKQLFEAAPGIFSGKQERASQKDQAEAAKLHEQLRVKVSLIAELAQDNIVLKKSPLA